MYCNDMLPLLNSFIECIWNLWIHFAIACIRICVVYAAHANLKNFLFTKLKSQLICAAPEKKKIFIPHWDRNWYAFHHHPPRSSKKSSLPFFIHYILDPYMSVSNKLITSIGRHFLPIWYFECMARLLWFFSLMLSEAINTKLLIFINWLD